MTATATTTNLDAVLIRPAAQSDAGTLERLAQLDSASALHGDVLLAEVDGQVLAALRVDDHAHVADPFARTSDLVDLLAARAERIRVPVRSERRRRRVPVLRPAA
jgi:hypothetical protein